MLSARAAVRRNAKDEAEKPFWISFADLMTALMVMFLLVMSVALLAVTKTVTEAEQREAQWKKEVDELIDRVAKASSRYPGVSVDRERRVIDFGDKARFDTGSHQLLAEQQRLLRAFVPEVLAIARDELGQRWLKRIVAEGFADQRGTYLFNLNLSLQRSQRVLCALLAPPFADERAMTAREREQIRELFLVGGYSFNSAKASFAESRRIELRLEFYGVRELKLSTEGITRASFGTCAL
jgi:outer membrane protein OmpA-like peptidoglycan-associated protein